MTLIPSIVFPGHLHITDESGQVVAILRKCEEGEGRGFVIQRRRGEEYFSPDGQWYAHANYGYLSGKQPPQWPDPVSAITAFGARFGKVSMG
ncbi:MAG: hypothetical protein KY468_11810 [Armatimonadetes bacterium]|nr:hypothetical protein [Armatimonadota bacterium]